MKILSLFIAGFAALVVSANAQVPVGPGSIKLGKVAHAMVTTPEFQITGGASKRYEIKKWLEIEVPYETVAAEIDELTFKFTVLVEKNLLEGEATYVNITKGRDKYAVIYLSPKSIEKLTGGKPMTGVDNIWVEVNRQGQVLAKESLKAGPQPNVTRKSGMLLTKEKTPFAPLYYDRYEELKPTR